MNALPYYSNNCSKVTESYSEILLALKFEEDYFREQHHYSKNYCAWLWNS